EVVGICAEVNHSEKIGFGGAFCVHEKYRNLDIGHRAISLKYLHLRITRISNRSFAEKSSRLESEGWEMKCEFNDVQNLTTSYRSVFEEKQANKAKK
ncbi:hypothetical protein NPIL_369261, partial [Nephila pilipes]